MCKMVRGLTRPWASGENMLCLSLCRRGVRLWGLYTTPWRPFPIHYYTIIITFFYFCFSPSFFFLSLQIGAAGDVGVQQGMRTYALCITCAATAGTAEYQVRVCVCVACYDSCASPKGDTTDCSLMFVWHAMVRVRRLRVTRLTVVSSHGAAWAPWLGLFGGCSAR